MLVLFCVGCSPLQLIVYILKLLRILKVIYCCSCCKKEVLKSVHEVLGFNKVLLGLEPRFSEDLT